RPHAALHEAAEDGAADDRERGEDERHRRVDRAAEAVGEQEEDERDDDRGELERGERVDSPAAREDPERQQERREKHGRRDEPDVQSGLSFERAGSSSCTSAALRSRSKSTT